MDVTQKIRKRLPYLNMYCVICDREHLFSGVMLKPAVCSRELCCWSFQQLGVATDAADNVATSAEVVDLLVCMATAAALSARANLVSVYFPCCVRCKDFRPIPFALSS